jgi:hypothetical protein
MEKLPIFLPMEERIPGNGRMESAMDKAPTSGVMVGSTRGNGKRTNSMVRG